MVVQWSLDVVPMPNEVITHINYLGHDQPFQPVFLDCNGIAIGDTDAINTAGVPPADVPVDDIFPAKVPREEMDTDGIDNLGTTTKFEPNPEQTNVELNDLVMREQPEPALV